VLHEYVIAELKILDILKHIPFSNTRKIHDVGSFASNICMEGQSDLSEMKLNAIFNHIIVRSKSVLSKVFDETIVKGITASVVHRYSSSWWRSWIYAVPIQSAWRQERITGIWLVVSGGILFLAINGREGNP